MKKFIIEDDFWALFPNAKIGIIICEGIDNSIKDVEKCKEMLQQAEKEAHQFFEKEEFSSNPAISVWREAFQKFKTKKRARASISLRYGLPGGGEDIDTFVGDIRLTKAEGNEQFIPLGSDENASPYEGEIVYKDDAGAICDAGIGGRH